MRIFRAQTISARIICFSFSLVLMTITVLMVMLAIQKHRVAPRFGEIIRQQAREEASKLIQNVVQNCAGAEGQIQRQLARSLDLTREVLAREGTISLSTDKVVWQAQDQLTHQISTLELPKFLVGDKWFGQNHSATVASPVVDEGKHLTGGEVTIFQRMNERGDMLRVCTSVLTTNGARAVGTYISSVNPDGNANPLIATVLQGKTFSGRAFVVNGWYDAKYEPLWDTDHKQVIGMLFVGLDITSATRAVREAVMRISIGKTGYMYVLGGKGGQRGQYLISKKGERDGENIWETKDSSGGKPVQAIVSKALNAGSTNVDFVEYLWANPGDHEPRIKFAAVSYFEPWDWVIGCGAFFDEFSGVEKAAMTPLNQLYLWMLIAAGAMSGIALGGSLWMARTISRPVKHAADQLAAGAAQTSAAASQVASSSHSLASGASQQAGSLQETSASLEEMASMTKLNSEHARKVEALGKEATALADMGAMDMRTMTQAMEAMKVSSDEVAKIISSIDEIAFQTNILALNAAVEAARAGEAGMGFAVVADEVRNLAQRSAQAAKETTHKIQDAISKTGQGMGTSVKVAQRLSEIVAKVHEVNELATKVSKASIEQTQGITQINHSVSEMDKVTQSNAASSEEIASAAQELNSQAESINESVIELLRLVGGEQLAARRFPPPETPAGPAGAHQKLTPRTQLEFKRPRQPDRTLAV